MTRDSIISNCAEIWVPIFGPIVTMATQSSYQNAREFRCLSEYFDAKIGGSTNLIEILITDSKLKIKIKMHKQSAGKVFGLEIQGEKDMSGRCATSWLYTELSVELDTKAVKSRPS